MGGNTYAEEVKAPEKAQIELLICTCGDCTHWEIGRDCIICKTCGHRFHVIATVPEHDKLQWKEHER